MTDDSTQTTRTPEPEGKGTRTTLFLGTPPDSKDAMGIPLNSHGVSPHLSICSYPQRVPDFSERFLNFADFPVKFPELNEEIRVIPDFFYSDFYRKCFTWNICGSCLNS